MRYPALPPFADRRDGTVAILTAASTVLICLVIGVAVDFSQASVARTRLQNAVDSAVLAGARLGTTETEVRAEAERYLAANDAPAATVTSFTYDAVSGQVSMTVTETLKPTFMAMVGKSTLDVRATATADVAAADVEVAMVLDNSGSMSGTRIGSLKTAARDLVAKVYAAPGSSPKFAVVPFAGLVNVGSTYATATWIDKDAKSPIHSQNFDTAANRLSLYASMGVAWAGCVEARPMPYDVTDELPTTSEGSTLFVPSFAVDEPGDSTPGAYDTYWNSYLGDNAGSCTGSLWYMSDETRQARICKYDGSSPRVEDRRGSISGPNALCDSVALTPLTATRTSIEAAIDAMRAKGGTNIAEGLAWGWRVLSPSVPFTEGVAYSDPKIRKVAVLMTDGENNWIGSSSSINRSFYSAYGYSANNRIGTTSFSNSTLQSAIDDRLEILCENVKKAGVDIYTVTFDVSDSSTRSLMQACATTPGQAYFPSSETGLKNAFAEIGRSIGDMRLSR